MYNCSMPRKIIYKINRYYQLNLNYSNTAIIVIIRISHLTLTQIKIVVVYTPVNIFDKNYILTIK